jgi:lysophospholipase L1-like esterase
MKRFYSLFFFIILSCACGLPSSLSSDGTHPNKDGYTIMESVILPILQAYPAE